MRGQYGFLHKQLEGVDNSAFTRYRSEQRSILETRLSLRASFHTLRSVCTCIRVCKAELAIQIEGSYVSNE